jgi:hypothetical protein
MDDIFLSDLEVRSMTRRARYKQQAEALDQMGVTYKIRGDGSLLVLRGHVENLLGGQRPVPSLVEQVRPDAIEAVNHRIDKFRQRKAQ